MIFKQSLQFVRSDCSRMVQIACLESFKQVEFRKSSHLLPDSFSLDFHIEMSSEKLLKTDSGLWMEVLFSSQIAPVNVLTSSLIQDGSKFSRPGHEKVTEFRIAKSSVLISVISLENKIKIAVSSINSQRGKSFSKVFKCGPPSSTGIKDSEAINKVEVMMLNNSDSGLLKCLLETNQIPQPVNKLFFFTVSHL